jgi:hypothetical protein
VIGPVNLASRPFRNERLPALLLWTAVVVLAGLSVRHGFVVRGLLSPRSVGIEREVRALDAEAEKLRTERAAIRAPRPDADTLRQWTLVANLVDRRAFSWTDLLARIEDVLPPGVHLVAVAPVIDRGQVKLDFTAVARTRDEALELVRGLQSRKDFQDVFPTGLDDRLDEGHELGISLRYVPAGGVPAPLRGQR